MHTDLCDLFGIEFPIFAFTHCRDVAAAVSKAGGMGILGVAAHSPKGLRAELEWIEKEVGDKPYGVDLLLPAKFVGSDRQGGDFDESELDARIPAEALAASSTSCSSAYEVPQLPPDTKLTGEMLVGFDKQREVIEMLFEYKIKLIASALGPPPAWMIEQGRARGVKVAALAGTVEHARRHVAAASTS